MRDGEIEALLRALRRIKRERAYSLRGLAKLLDVSAGHLSMIFRGERRPGFRFLRAVVRRFPELGRLVKTTLDPDEPPQGN